MVATTQSSIDGFAVRATQYVTCSKGTDQKWIHSAMSKQELNLGKVIEMAGFLDTRENHLAHQFHRK